MSENVPQTPLSQDIFDVERKYRKHVTVITARPRIVRAVFLAWGAGVTLLLLFFLASVGWYGVEGMFQDNAYTYSLLENSALTHARLRAAAPESLIVGRVQSLAAGSGEEYDLYVEVKNPNTRHAAEFLLTFVEESGEVMEKKSFLNPGETAFIIAPRATAGKPKNASAEVGDMRWVYLSPHVVEQMAAWYSERASFAVADVVFARDIAYTDATVSRTTFTVKNYTPYSYWEPHFTVRILRGSTILGIADIASTKFLSGEERVIDMRWFGEFPQTATVAVTPRIPYFDESAYMDPEQSSASDVRTRWTEED